MSMILIFTFLPDSDLEQYIQLSICHLFFGVLAGTEITHNPCPKFSKLGLSSMCLENRKMLIPSVKMSILKSSLTPSPSSPVIPSTLHYPIRLLTFPSKYLSLLFISITINFVQAIIMSQLDKCNSFLTFLLMSILALFQFIPHNGSVLSQTQTNKQTKMKRNKQNKTRCDMFV